MLLVSRASLVAMAFVVSLDYLLLLFLIYVIWTRLVIGFFMYCGEDMRLSGVGERFLFCFLLVSYPASISVFYKLVMGSCIFSCCFLVFFC
jgi:hypothetical protein